MTNTHTVINHDQATVFAVWYGGPLSLDLVDFEILGPVKIAFNIRLPHGYELQNYTDMELHPEAEWIHLAELGEDVTKFKLDNLNPCCLRLTGRYGQEVRVGGGGPTACG